MTCMFKWVHLSDLHFQPQSSLKGNFNSNELKKKLPRFLSSKISNTNALIITGDYRFAPNKDENPTSVVEYINKLAGALNLESSRVYLVPGNHDLTRSITRNDVIRGLRDAYAAKRGTFDTERLNVLKQGFSFFDELKTTFSAVDSKENPHGVITLENCNLLLLNTAITAGMDKDGKVDDEHNLLIGSNYLSAAVHDIKNRNPTIAVGHHGMQFLQEGERKTCVKFLDEENIRLYLCGHTHQLWNESFGDDGRQVTVGCLMQEDNSVDAGFSVGQLFSDGSVDLKSYQWDSTTQNWYNYQPQEKRYNSLYPITTDTMAVKADTVEKIVQADNPFSLYGYHLLGARGIEGIKYTWKKDGRYIESLAFNKRLKDSDDPDVSRISAYTSSVSYGCHLSINSQQCRFCETGRMPYYGDACAEDIALQNIFMAEYDSDCPSFPHVRNNAREFAFMGQGEPGFCYPAIRRAIQLTDYAMEKIQQKVHRYIISTSGICDFVPLLTRDIEHGVLKSKVTLHFSLNTIGDERTMLMPVNREHDYKRFLKECEELYKKTGEKIGVGILMFNNYEFADARDDEKPFSLTNTRLEEILLVLNKDIFRIDLCDVNHTVCGKQPSLSNEQAHAFLELVKTQGFEGKISSSFGHAEQSGCGMLVSSLEKIISPGNTTVMHFNNSLQLLNEAISSLD